MGEIPSNNTGLSGEYFVAAELYRRGYNVGMTIGNAKAVDLFAERKGHVVPIQVKSIFKKKHSGFPMMKEKIKRKVLYVFVCLNGDTMDLPTYYIASSREVHNKIKQYSTRGIVPLGSLKSNKYFDRWDKIEKFN